MIKTKNLTYRYQGADAPIRFPDIQAAQGQPLVILGPSGCGKTTLLQLLAGLRRPESGSVLLGQCELTKMRGSRRDRVRGQEIGIVFQEPHFVRSINILDNLKMCRYFAGMKKNRQKAIDLLERLGIDHLRDRRPEQLSVGERQRAAIAMALINEPSLLLADEPTSALDDQNANKVVELLRTEAERFDSTLLIVTHDQRLHSSFSHKIEL